MKGRNPPKIAEPKDAATKHAFAYFTCRGIPYFVLVREATPEQQRLTGEYQAKTIPHRYYENMVFVRFTETATEYFDLYPETG